jgi:DNA-binding transcriptional MocR family regulator
MNFEKDNAKKIYCEELAKYEEYKKLGLNLNMSRGKPSKEQLDLSNAFFDVLTSKSDFRGSQDYRSYGLVDGIPEAKKLFADLSGVSDKEVIVMGNSSLNIMYDSVQRAMQFGVSGGVPFNKQGGIKWLCPVPGYDRHFAVTELFGAEMINVSMKADGPDMDVIENLVKDEKVKGIWCVPKYSNPQGIVYSDEVVERFAKLRPAAKDFRIYWDNAYAVHYITEDVPLKNLLQTAKAYGNEDIVYMFGSTSKITFAGGGVAWMCASEANIADIKKYLSIQTIGHNKLNQLAHVRFFGDADGIRKQMAKHAAIIRPRFEAVLKIFDEELKGLCSWVNPKGGYFISIDLPEFTAKRAVQLAKDAGVVMTGAGATFPYKKDPKDSNLRIAPTLPTVGELEKAMKVFCCCVKIAWAEKSLNA